MHTARLLLRRFDEEDANLIITLNAQPKVMRYLGNGRPMPRALVLAEELPRLMAHNARCDDLGFWAAFTGSIFIGWFCAEPRHGDVAEVELGYRLMPSVWGRGYASEGARLMVSLAFAAGAERVLATTMTVNTASRRVLENAGLRYVRTWFGEWDEPIPGAEQGDVDYALERGARISSDGRV